MSEYELNNSAGGRHGHSVPDWPSDSSVPDEGREAGEIVRSVEVDPKEREAVGEDEAEGREAKVSP